LFYLLSLKCIRRNTYVLRVQDGGLGEIERGEKYFSFWQKTKKNEGKCDESPAFGKMMQSLSLIFFLNVLLQIYLYLGNGHEKDDNLLR